VRVKIIPILLQSLLCILQQAHNILRWRLLSLFFGRRVILADGRVATIINGMLDALLINSAELLLELTVVAVGVVGRKGLAGGEEEWPRQGHKGLGHHLFYYYYL
jgi:hypothetical protein